MLAESAHGLVLLTCIRFILQECGQKLAMGLSAAKSTLCCLSVEHEALPCAQNVTVW